jgi:DNA repair exonuclease SbcCD ATPase subunit
LIVLLLQEELKERFKDMQDDAQLARDEVSSLLQQRDEWTEQKSALEQTVADMQQRDAERDEMEQRRQQDGQRQHEEMQALQLQLREADQRERDRAQQTTALEAELQRMRDSESQLNDTLRKTRVALTQEKSKLKLYRNASANPTPVNAAPTRQASLLGAVREQEEPAEPVAAPQVRPDSPYILQQEIRPIVAPGGTVTDLDDDEAGPAVIRTLVPSVTRLAEIQAIHSSNPLGEEER